MERFLPLTADYRSALATAQDSFDHIPLAMLNEADGLQLAALAGTAQRITSYTRLMGIIHAEVDLLDFDC